MKILITLLALALSVIGYACASPVSMDFGEYKATFDVGNNDTLSIDIEDPLPGELYEGTSTTNYQGLAEGDYGLVQVTITEFDVVPKQTGPQDDSRLVSSLLQYFGCPPPVQVNRKIDGHDAILSAGNGCEGAEEKSAGVYWLSDRIRVLVYSRYPWKEGSAKLFNTIHVELVD